jgi:hypothetical protein
MIKTDDIGLRIVISLVLLVGLLYLPSPVFSQQAPAIGNVIINGDFDKGFQEFGVGYDWGGFSNGQAVVGWGVDTWEKVILEGQTNLQMIEIKDAQERNRYAGIYQTVSVIPGQQYKLTIKGIIRSEEGDVKSSDYGYRLQYGVDYSGGTAWELVADKDWQELPWDEQSLDAPPDGAYRFDTFETTITAKNDQLTLFIRGWKKWVNNGSGIFNIQQVSLVGPILAGFEEAEEVGISESAGEFTAPAADSGEESASDQPQNESPLPVSGQGQDDSITYVVIISITLLLILFAGAITTTARRHKQTE